MSMEDAAAEANAALPLYLQKYSGRMQTDEGRKIRDRFNTDPRVRGLANKLINYGSHGRSFTADDLAQWFLYCRDELGPADAERATDRFFEEETIRVIESQWVFGLAVADVVQIGDGFELRPIDRMPESEARERYARASRQMSFDDGIRPVAAFVREYHVRKFSDIHSPNPPTPDFNAIRRRLGVLPLLVNALPRVSCLPGVTTSYCTADVPFGPFGTGGGGCPQYDVIGRDVTRFAAELGPKLFALLCAYESWKSKDQLWLQLMLHRLCQAKRHGRLENKMLDLGITLEMALLRGRGKVGGNTQAFCSRGAAFLAKSRAHDQKLRHVFAQIYDARSSVVHEGTLHRTAGSARNASGSIRPWTRLTERIVSKVIVDAVAARNIWKMR